MDTFKSWWLQKTVLKKSNWNTPKEENNPIEEEHTPWTSPLPPWAFPSWYDLPVLEGVKFSQAEELPQIQTQIREPISFVVRFSPPD